MTPGAAAGDFNNDGWEDLFFLGGDFSTDALFINNQDGTFSNEAAAWGIDATHIGTGAAVGDFNNDGWLDIYVTSMGAAGVLESGHNRLYQNNGNNTFTNVATTAGVTTTNDGTTDAWGSAFGDYDLDGDLDLFVTAWRVGNNGNRLYQNNGNGTFTDVTTSANVQDINIQGFSPCFQDMNGDRFPELLIAADFGTTRYYKNNGDGTFTNYTTESGADLYVLGMGSAVGDFNGDGLFDWFITSINDPGDPVQWPDYNKLHINHGNHIFTETAQTAGVDNSFWGWGAIGVDINHDTTLDLFTTNGGYLDRFLNRPSTVWLNNDDGTFTDVAASTGFNHTGQGRGILNFDHDRDGDQDIVITSSGEPMVLYQTELGGAATNWLTIKLDTSTAPHLAPNGFGSRVQITVDGQQIVRAINGCSNFLSQSELTAHFGVGDATAIDELSIEWADGNVTILQNVAANQHLTIAPYFSYLPLIFQSDNGS